MRLEITSRSGVGERNTSSLKISCLVVVRNMIKTIRRCLQSLIEEGVDEIVVVNGHSTDGTSGVIERFPVTHLYDNRGGIPPARNIGLRACTGDYILIVDGDQWIPRGFIRKLKELLVAADYDAVLCTEIWLGTSIWANAYRASWAEVAALRERWFYRHKVLKRSAICLAGGWNEQFKAFEDIDLWNRMKRFNPKVCNAGLVIYSDASNMSPAIAFRRGIRSYVSMPLYVARYPSDWRAILSVAPIGWVIDSTIALKVYLKTGSIKVALAALVLRMAMSLGRFIRTFLHPLLG